MALGFGFIATHVPYRASTIEHNEHQPEAQARLPGRKVLRKAECHSGREPFFETDLLIYLSINILRH